MSRIQDLAPSDWSLIQPRGFVPMNPSRVSPVTSTMKGGYADREILIESDPLQLDVGVLLTFLDVELNVKPLTNANGRRNISEAVLSFRALFHGTA